MEKKGWMRQLGRKNRIMAGAALLFVVMAVIGICGMYSTLLESARVLGRDLVHSFAQDEELNISRFRNEVSLGMAYLEEMHEMGVGEEEREEWVRDYFYKMKEALPEAEVEAYAILNGRLIAERPWDGMEEYDYTRSEWYQKAAGAGGGVIFTDAYVGENRDDWVVSVAAVDLESGDGIILDLWKDSFHVFHENQSLPEYGAYYLCDARGQLLYGNTHFPMTEEQLEAFALDLYTKADKGEVTEQDNDILGINGEKRGVYFSYLHDGWFCAMTMPYAALLKGMRSLFGWYIAVFALFLLTASLMYYRNRQLSAAMRKEKEIARSLGNSYYAFYRVNAERNTYEIVKGSEYINAKLPVNGEYMDLIRMVAGIMDAESRQEFLESFSREKIGELIKQKTEGFGGDFLRRFGKEYRWINVSLLVDEGLGREEGVLCFRKIHEEKQHQREYQKLLEDALAAEERSERSQKQFFASMSHEMKTPLNIIIGMADMVQNPSTGSEKAMACLKKIKDSARQLSDFINDILENSRVEQGFKEREWQDFDLREAVLESIGDYSVQAGQEGKELSVEMDIVNRMVSGNRSYLVQVLDQLLSNAVKFTHTGDRICVKVGQTGERGNQRYSFTVEDTGIGMAEDFLPKLFAPYAAVKRFGKQKSGRGLGLAIVRNLVMQMGGVVHAESKLGKGSSFLVTIPFLVTDAGGESGTGVAGRKEPETADVKERAVTVTAGRGKPETADAEKESGTGIAGWKDPENAGEKIGGLDVTEAESGEKETAGAGLADRDSETEAAGSAVSGAGTGGDSAAEAASGDGTPGDAVEKGRENGEEDAAEAGEEEGDELAGCRILVAEDNPLNMEIAVELLQMAGAEVDCAVNGQEAVDLFRDSAVGYYDALLFDMQMPVLDGCGAAEAIRKMGRPDAAAVPIAALTANTLAEDVARTAHAGMNVHMAKPVMAEKLWKTLNGLIAESRKEFSNTL